MSIHTLRLILGDQLNAAHSWFQERDSGVLYLMAEMRQETDYARHHIQKVIGFFAAMRNFADELTNGGHQVRYVQLDDADNPQSLPELIDAELTRTGAARFEYQLPDEYRLDRILAIYCEGLDTEFGTATTEHFLTTRHELKDFFAGKKQYLMESFYRDMRKRFDLLMEGKKPLGGKWNYDAENRKKLPTKHALPEFLTLESDQREIAKMIANEGVSTIGNVDAERFAWPTDRAQSLQLLDWFLEHALPLFGTYQDAMSERHFSLYHSRISFSMNVKLLSPLEVVERAIERFEASEGEISLAQIEGFVRQIIGWREYMRGVYWAQMPGYASLNHFGHKRRLPVWYWSGDTKMACLKHAVSQSLDFAYAHHIQRLMVTGNFALLAGIDPDEVDAWYLGIYIDALEWVEITNTRGMSQYADGGIVGSKPYVSSGNYIHKMSDYCKGCSYDHKKKVTDDACPFNSLYWHFYHRHRARLEGHPRIGYAYRTWDKMGDEKQRALLAHAERTLSELDSL